MNRRRFVLAEQVRTQFIDIEFAEFAEEITNVRIRAVEPFGNDVHLGAITCREHDRFANVVTKGEARNPLREVRGRDGETFEQWQRTAAMVDPDDE